MAELHNEKDSGEELNDDIGGKIRRVRRDKDITLQELAEKTGLSIGYLSNLERNSNSPTLDNLQRVCGALEVSLIELLDEKNQYKKVIRENERKIVYEKDNVVRYESIKFGSELMDGLVIKLKPHKRFDAANWVHKYDEIGLILKGRMYLIIEEEKIELEEGDAFYIKAGANHSLGNDSGEECVSYWVKNA